MYKYLQYQYLTGNSKRDKTTLIMADRYMIDNNNLLYRIDVPRQKNLARLKPTVIRLCIPLRFRHNIIAYVHDQSINQSINF